MATIRDVAKKAGVSIATVSATLNGTKKVSERLQKRVRAAVEAVGYTPNTLAQSLKRGSTRLIGLILPDITNPFFAVLARAVEKAASDNGYTVFLFNTDEEPQKEKEYLRHIHMHQAEGLILAPSGSGEGYGRQLSGEVKMPAVLVDRTVEGLAWDSVASSNQDGARRAVTHLIECGHKKIGGVFGRESVSTIKERRQGYLLALQAAGLPIDQELIRMGGNNQERAGIAAQALLNLPERPTALFASNNQVMLGVMHAIHSQGLSCPQDISVTGFDGLGWAEFMKPPMTTVEQSVAEMGELGVKLLLKRLNGSDDPPQNITLPTQFLVRNSSQPPK
jgi:DNA-binding LacI/PurR family transcriptional regulator